APGAAENHPPVDAEGSPQELNVAEEVLGRITREVRGRIACVRRAPAAAALVEKDDPVGGGIERPADPGRAAGAGPAVQHDDGFSLRIPADLPVDPIALADVERSALVRFDLRVEFGHLYLSGCSPMRSSRRDHHRRMARGAVVSD